MGNRVELLFLDNLRRFSLRHGQYFAAVSGGLDSTAMLHLLHRFSSGLGIELVVVHVHHHVRGKAADMDAEFVANVAKELQIPFLRLDVYPPQNANEDVLRQLRYEIIETAMSEMRIEGCFMAHTANDVAETVLMRLSEGAGVRGLGGIPARQGKVLRPMLNIFRSDIERWAKSKDIRWVEDYMNADLHYKRVRARRMVLPAFEQAFGESGVRNVVNSARFCAEAYEALKDLLSPSAFKLDEETFSINELLRLNRASRILAIKFILEGLFPGYPPRRELIERTLDVVESKNPHAMAQLGEGLFALRQYGKLYIGRNESYFSGMHNRLISALIAQPGEYDIGCGILHVWSNSPPNSIPKEFVASLSLDVRPFPWIVRPRSRGDRIIPAGHSSPKRLSRLLVDKKIPKSRRDDIPIVESDGNIFFVPGVAVAENGNPPDLFVWFEPSDGYGG